MRRYTGNEPCPGCGKSAQQSPRAYKDSVCFACLRDLKEMKKIKEARKKQSENYVMFRVNDLDVKYISSFDSDVYDNLVKAFDLFLETLDSPEKASKNTDYFNHGSAIYRDSFMLHVVPVIRETTAISLDSLITALEQYSKVVYAQGRLDGSNILKQLNEDKITLQKFDELRNLY